MEEINVDALTEIEEIESILTLSEEAKKYLTHFKWCVSIKKCWYNKEYGIYNKLGIFLFEIEPINDTVDDFVWIIVGDLPSVYLDKEVKTAKEALTIYCELMEEWIECVKNEKDTSECFPIPVEPTVDHAELLGRRIAFIRRELLAIES